MKSCLSERLRARVCSARMVSGLSRPWVICAVCAAEKAGGWEKWLCQRRSSMERVSGAEGP